MIINRRGILMGLASALAAPAIVHTQNLMPVRAVKDTISIYPHEYDWIEVSLGYTIAEVNGVPLLRFDDKPDMAFDVRSLAVGDKITLKYPISAQFLVK